jgi:hypothetical protein
MKIQFNPNPTESSPDREYYVSVVNNAGDAIGGLGAVNKIEEVTRQRGSRPPSSI